MVEPLPPHELLVNVGCPRMLVFLGCFFLCVGRILALLVAIAEVLVGFFCCQVGCFYLGFGRMLAIWSILLVQGLGLGLGFRV